MTCPSCGFVFPPVAPTPLGPPRRRHTRKRCKDAGRYLLDVGSPHVKKERYPDAQGHVLWEPQRSRHYRISSPSYTTDTPGYKAMERLKSISGKVGVDYMVQPSLDALCDELGRSSAPTEIAFTKNGKFFEIVDRIWGEK